VELQNYTIQVYALNVTNIQNLNMMNKEGLVYIGDILDYGDGWVDMETAEMLLAENC
jgi:hypothetical protein